MFARYAAGLRSFFQTTIDEAEALRLIREQTARRESAFLQILERGVYGNEGSPYRKLLDHAGLRYADVEALVASRGVEGALEELLARGVYLTIDEFKTRKPIRRPGLEIHAHPRDFDNPLLTTHYESRTGGSRGSRTRLVVDLGFLAYEAAHTHLLVSQFGLEETPIGMWRELPPGMVGIKNWLRFARIGRRVDKWFSQVTPRRRIEDFKFHAFTVASGWLGALWRRPLPKPEHVPTDDALPVARWLAGMRRRGTPAMMDTNASTCARTCIAARDAGLDIRGSFFRVSAEPFTPARARLVAEAGCRAASTYSCAELGYIGMACADPEHPDEVHLMTDKVAMIRRKRAVGDSGLSVDAFLFTTVLRSCPKLMLNVEIGDYGVVAERRCNCLIDSLGFHVHMHDIRSFEKLTAAGNTFLGPELIALVEEVLPARFGGSQLDYQFIEEEEPDGRARVSLVVNPRLNGAADADLLETVLTHLREVPGGRLMTDVWRDSKTLRVVRREPYSTGALKFLPLHILMGARR